jgi:hypothetical protein
MTRNCRNVTGFVVAAVLFILAGQVLASLEDWNAEITAANPLNWYRFDEPPLSTDPNVPSDPNCYDYGSDGLNGVYSNVALAQDGVLGAETAALFTRTALSIITFSDATPIEGDWTVEYIVNKRQWWTAALHDDTFTSIRMEGYNTWDVGFTFYNKGYLPEYGQDYTFHVVEFQSAQPPIGKWIHLVFRSNEKGTQVFINGMLVGTSRDKIAFPRAHIGQGSRVGTDPLGATLDEVVVFDRALTDEEIARHAFAGLPDLIPDGFERYTDSTELASLWTSDATLTLETSEVHKGSKSMKAQFATSGSIEKPLARKDDYTGNYGHEISIQLKGDATNNPGDVTLSVLDSDGVVFADKTYVNATQLSNWMPLVITVRDPNLPWSDVSGVKIDVGAASTMYFDELNTKAPTPRKVVEWKFNDGGGNTASDSSGNNIDGSMEGFVSPNWVDGRTGQAGDYAIEFSSKQTQKITALNLDLPALGLSDIFKGDSSWTINIWVRFEQLTNISMIGGFGDCSYQDLTEWEDRYFNQWEADMEFNFNGGADYNWAFWYWDLAVDRWQMWTITYNKWTRLMTLYRDGRRLRKSQRTLVDTPQNSVKLGNVGTVFNADDAQVPLEAQLDDFCIWDGEIPWMDDDPETDDVLSLYGGSICYNSSPYDSDGDCKVNITDLVEIATAWLEDGRITGDL